MSKYLLHSLTVFALALALSGAAAAQNGGPTLQETQKWIQDELSGLKVSNGSGTDTTTTKYLKVEFSGCRFNLSEEFYSNKLKGYLYTNYYVDLKVLQEITTGESKGGAWGVYVETYKGFRKVLSLNSSFSPSDEELTKEFAMMMPSQSLAERMGKAFNRLLALCREEPGKTPF